MAVRLGGHKQWKVKENKNKRNKQKKFHFSCLCPLGLTIKLNFNRKWPIVAPLLSNSSFHFFY